MQKRRWMTLIGALVAILSLALFAAACGSDDNGADSGSQPTAAHEEEPTEPADEPTEPADGNGAETSIDAGLSDDFVIALSVDSADAGAVTFSVSNNGALPHNFNVIKTDAGPGELPQDAGAVDETQVDVVAATEDILGGESAELSADLEPGSYVLICNIPGHYLAGMEVGFTVN